MKSAMIAAVLVLGGAISAPASAQMKARVAWTSFASNMSGTWVAQEEGFFKKNGLEVELVHIPSTSRAIQVMLAGELNYSYMDGRNSVTAALKGDDVDVRNQFRRSEHSFHGEPVWLSVPQR